MPGWAHTWISEFVTVTMLNQRIRDMLDSLYDALGLRPKVIAAGHSGATGYGAFRTVNNAKKVVTIAAGTLVNNGDALQIAFTGSRSAAAFWALYFAIGTTDYGIAGTGGSSLSGSAVALATIVRISATSVSVSWLGNCCGVTNQPGVGVPTPLTVSDLASNAFDLTLGIGDSAGPSNDSILRSYRVMYEPAV